MTILINNFSLGVESWTAVADLDYFAVDVVDLSYPISVSGTYFIHDGQIVSTTHSGIPNGYRCYYYPSSVYSDGTISLVIHAENTASGVEEAEFRLLYGYHCEFAEYVDWGPNNEIIFTIDTSNLAVCPNIEGEAFYFETADLTSFNLGACISAIESVNLNASIYPQNTFFFYGRTYTVTVSGVKDFSGNELAPRTFTFTIEDPTN